MNCFYHYDTTAVATCQDCHKGLCPDCASRYSIPICMSCNHKRISVEKNEIRKEFLISIGFAIFTCYLYSQIIQNSTKPLESLDLYLMYGVFFYLGFSIVSGWKTLNAITPNVFLILPILGWVIFFIIKFILAFLIGPIVLPLRWFKKIQRWKTLEHIKAIP